MVGYLDVFCGFDGKRRRVEGSDGKNVFFFVFWIGRCGGLWNVMVFVRGFIVVYVDYLVYLDWI